MSIFISHSSDDLWIAEEIDRRLREVGAETFRCEVGIEVGTLWEDKVKKQLRDCTEVLIVLSPQAFESDWVMIEVGVAWMLDKDVVLILCGVAQNDLHEPMKKWQYKELNAIGEYIAQVERRLHPDESETPPPVVPPEATPPPIAPPESAEVQPVALHHGDGVRILGPKPDEHRSQQPGWNPRMRGYLGEITTVRSVEAGYVELEIDDGAYAWAPRWLERT